MKLNFRSKISKFPLYLQISWRGCCAARCPQSTPARPPPPGGRTRPGPSSWPGRPPCSRGRAPGPAWTRGRWSGSPSNNNNNSSSRVTGAGWASAATAARTAGTASATTCGTRWCTCSRVSRGRSVTRTRGGRALRDRCDANLRAEETSLGSIIFTQKCDCDTSSGSRAPHSSIGAALCQQCCHHQHP